MITSTSVVDDPYLERPSTRTIPTAHPESRGVWTFGSSHAGYGPHPRRSTGFHRAPLPDVAHRSNRQRLYGVRPAGHAVQVLDNWPRTPERQAGSRTVTAHAASYRQSHRRPQSARSGHAGEGRFVFAVNSRFGGPLEFTVIVEYNLLGADRVGCPSSGRTSGTASPATLSHPRNTTRPSRPSRCASAVETRHLVASTATRSPTCEPTRSRCRSRWELREFVLSPESGMLQEGTVKLTPDLAFNGSQVLADFVNQNESAIIAEQHTVPDQFQGLPFAAGSVFNDQIFWFGAGHFQQRGSPQAFAQHLQRMPRTGNRELHLLADLSAVRASGPKRSSRRSSRGPRCSIRSPARRER